MNLLEDSILVIEGVPALALEPVTNRPVVRLHVKADEHARLARVSLAIEQSGRDDVESYLRDRSRDEEPFVARLSERAATIVDISADMISRTGPTT